MKYKAILADVDGTLVKIGQNTISPKVKEAIGKAEKNHVLFGMATGRSISLLGSLLSQLNSHGLHIIDNGSAVYDSSKQRIVWQSTFDATTANNLIKMVKEYHPKELGFATTKGRVRNPKKIALHTKVRKLRIASFPKQISEEIIHAISLSFSNLTAIETSSIDGEGFDVYVTNADATKQHAVLKIAEILRITTAEIIGVGDHYNDFPLLMACGLKVAMGNAVDDLKTIADYVAPSVDDDGLADVIEKFVISS